MPKPIRQSLTDELQNAVIHKEKSSSLDIEILLKHLSFTHCAELVKVDNPLKRAFYEREGIKGKWSVIELPKEEELKALIERDRSYLLSKT